MRLQTLLAIPPLLIPSVLAVFADDAFRIDYHIPLLGFPKPDTTFFQQPFPGSKASLIYTLSEKGILGAVNPKDGEIIWRQALQFNGTEGFLRAGEGQETVVSGVGNEVSAWSASDGRLVWSNKFGSALLDLEILELEDSAATKGVKDALVLTGGDSPVVRRLDGQTGSVKWEFEDQSGDAPYQVLASATDVYYISLHKTLLGGLNIKVVKLDSLTGHRLDQYTLSSHSDFSETKSILFVGSNSAAPIIAWTDKAKRNVKFNVVGDHKTSTFSIELEDGEELTDIAIHAPHRTNTVAPRILVHFTTAEKNWAVMYNVDLKRHVVAAANTLSKLQGKGAFAVSQSDANLYFTRITEQEVIVISSKYEIVGRWPIESFAVPGLRPDSESVYPVHAISEAAVRDGTASAVRAAVLLSTGDWVLIRNGEVPWSRPEALSGATAALWTDFEEGQDLAERLESESHSNLVTAYIMRVNRHIKDLQRLPGWLQALPKRIINSFISKEDAASDAAQNDSFGFSKRVVVATDNGRLIALDAGKSGKIIWNTQVDKFEPGEKWDAPELTIDPKTKGILIRTKGKEQLLFVDAETGQPWGTQPMTPPGDMTNPQGTVIYLKAKGELLGFLPLQSTEPVWRFNPAEGEEILSVTARPADDPVASIGHVLGDRRVRYKYLNPNLVLVTAATASGPTGSSVSFYLLDSVSGKLLHSQAQKGVDTSASITTTISENWFTYSFATIGPSTETSAVSGFPESHGYYLVVAELFESSVPNDRGPLGKNANFSSLSSVEDVKPYVESQTYQIPEEISSMSVTHTRQGITSRQLLVTLPKSNSIVGIPRFVIDPRRPIGRDPTAEEREEGLSRYAPVLEFDPKWYLNHKREVFGLKKVITSPALLESTSLVIAYGLDIFGTRVTPSFSFDMLGKDFNKLQMLATVAALWAGVTFVAPLVQRKMINARWQSP